MTVLRYFSGNKTYKVLYTLLKKILNKFLDINY